MRPSYTPAAPSVVAFLVLELHDDGAMSISGNVADVRCALGMVDSAREAVSRKLRAIPAVDVVAPHSPLWPVIPEGDRRE